MQTAETSDPHLKKPEDSNSVSSGEESLPSILKEALRGVGLDVPASASMQPTQTKELLSSSSLEKLLKVTFPLASGDVYRLEGEFARGGLGRILRAYDKRLLRQVAIKELLSESGHARERFLREVFVTARLQHPNIIPIHEAGRWSTGELFYAMKLINGRSLKEAITQSQSFEQRAKLLPHIIALCDAMAYAHSQKIIHRDLKPQNVLVGDFGETVVIDWGLAKELNEESQQNLTSAGAVLGTPTYMPPEQARGGLVDARADIYAIGAILYHALTGAPPYQGKNANEIIDKVLAGPPVHPALREPLMPKPLAEIIRKAIEPEPEKRFQEASALAVALRDSQSIPSAPKSHLYQNLTVLLGVLLIAAILFGFFT
jgi:serine/threonine protein kinase